MVKTAPRPDVAILLITFLLTVFTDLVMAVNIGVILAALLFMKRMSEAVVFEQQTADVLQREVTDFELPPRTYVFSMEGPYFFGAAERLESTLEHIHRHADTLVLRLGRVPFMDATGLQSLRDLQETCRRHHTRLVITEARPNVLEKLRRAGLLAEMGAGNVLADLQDLKP
jgi:SulP family sulfate permease